MPKVELRKRNKNVYFSPVTQPKPQWILSQQVSKRMPHESQENVDLWYSIFREIGEESADRKERRRTRR